MADQSPEKQAAAQAARAQFPVYTVSELGHELRQSEIISDLRQYVFDPVAGEAEEIIHPYAIVLTQDCDLLWDFEARQKQQTPELNGVLIYEVEPAPAARSKVAGSDIWKRIRQNRDDRYHTLEGVPAAIDLLNIGLPDMVIDFKRNFTLPADEIYRQCGAENGAKRRCRLEMPYREHLQSRAAFYFQRVTLPVPLQIAEIVQTKALAKPAKSKNG